MKGFKHKNNVGWSQKNYFFKVLSSFSNEKDITVRKCVKCYYKRYFFELTWEPPEIFWAL